MKRNIRNDKVIRAMTIGIATMLAATSAPITVFADDETPSETSAPDSSSSDSSSSSSSESSGSSESSAPVAEAPSAPAETPSAPAETVTAVATFSMEAAAPLVAEPTNPIDPVVNDPNLSGDEGADAAALALLAVVNGQEQGLLPDAISAVETAGLGEDSSVVKDLKEAEGLVAETEGDLTKLEDALKEEAKSNKEKEAKVSKLSSVSYAGDKDDQNTKEVSVLPTEADENGNLSLKYETDAEGKIVGPIYNPDGTIALEASTNDCLLVQDFYDTYSQAIVDINKGDLGEAEKKAEAAQAKLDSENAKVSALKEAIQDSKAAEAAVAAAKDKLNRIESIRATYVSFMKTYYEKMNNAKNVTEADFSSQAEILLKKDKTQKRNQNAQPGNDYDTSYADQATWNLGNDLLKQIVNLELIEEGVSEESIIWSSSKTDPKLGDNGRNKYYTVNYTDKNGNPGVKYVNDVFKDPFYSTPGNDESDLENGIIFISERFDTDNDKEHKPDTKWQAYKDPERLKAYSYDDFSSLPADLEAAKKAVADAEEKAAILREKVANAGKIATGKDTIDDMLEELDKAEKALANSQKQLDVLNELIGFLKEQVVDERGDDDNPSEDSGDDGSTDPVFDPGSGTLIIPGYEIPPITLPTTPSGVAGVRAAATRPAGVLGVKAPETKAEKVIANKTVVKPAAKKTVAQKGKKIADPETPLAATPFVDEDGMKIPWIWLLIIAALGAVGKKMYDEHKKKVQAEEEAKKYND